ncbi:MAG: hypothetical protein GY801_34850 [bacterium]|nr:hypothetical protein [bacterium]
MSRFLLSDMTIDNPDLMQHIASDAVLEETYTWLCERRTDYSPNDDVWDLRRRWAEITPQVQQTLPAGTYEFSPLAELRLPDGDTRQLWCAWDALVLKAMALVLGEYVEPALSERCFHVKGHGEAKLRCGRPLNSRGRGLCDEIGVLSLDNKFILFPCLQEYLRQSSLERFPFEVPYNSLRPSYIPEETSDSAQSPIAMLKHAIPLSESRVELNLT